MEPIRISTAEAETAAKPIPIDERPLDNEYAWKGNPYQMDGCAAGHPGTGFSYDDPRVAWFSDATGRSI
jgi:hypothetical protein